MQSKHALIALLAFLCLAAAGWFVFFDDSQAAMATWDETDEFVETAEVPATEVASDGREADPARAELANTGDESLDDPDAPRPLITIRGRVVNASAAPVAGAKVLLSAQSRGRRNRIEKSIESSNDGTFVFSGKGFTRLWVTLQVTHGDYAMASAFKALDDAKGTIDMGDIKVVEGGSIVGSITDMQGNICPGATAQVTPQDGRMRWRRGGGSNAELFPAVEADSAGNFRIAHIAPGRYRITATAPRRQRFSESPITVVDGKEERLDPIQLGPGFQLTGRVFDLEGKPLAKAEVNIRGRDRRNREEGKKTDKDGEFAFDHLAPGEYSVTVRAKGFLTNQENDKVKVTETPPLMITMEPGLKITGHVLDAVTNQPVTSYGAKIQRMRSVSDPDRARKIQEATALVKVMADLRGTEKRTPQQDLQLKELETKIRGIGLDRRELGRLMGGGRGRGGNRGRGGDNNARGTRGGGDRGAGTRGGGDRGGRGGFGRGGDRGGRGGFGRGGDRGGRGGFGRGGDRGGRGGFGRGGFGRGGVGGFGWGGDPTRPGDTGEVEAHPNGEFTFDGLEEGIYVVDIGSPDHQKLRSQEIEVRRGAGAPHVNLVVERGLMITGVVVCKSENKPIRRADVELRLVQEERQDTRQRSPEEQARRTQMVNMMRRMTNESGPRTSRLLSARTDANGKFEIKNAPPGKYLLRANAEGYTTISSEVFKLDKDRVGFELGVGALAVLEGRVSGVQADQLGDVQVMAYSFPRNMRSAKVEADGTYQITGLQPGGYIVRAFVGEARRFIFRELMGGMGRSGNGGNPQDMIDVQLKEGQTRRFNVAITVNVTGQVVGKVLVNGTGGQGYRVSLRKLETNGQASNQGRGFGRRGGGRNSATVDQHGEYRISEVEEGQYALTVSSSGGGGRRGRGGSTIAQRTVNVLAGRDTTAPTVVINIGTLQGTVKVPVDPNAKPGATPPSLRGRVSLYQGVTAVPEAGQEVLSFSARLRDGKFEAKDIPSGDYLLVLRVSGRDQVTQQVYVGSGSNSGIEVTAGAVRQPAKSPNGADPTNPGNRPNGARQPGATGPGTRQPGAVKTGR